jgi:hypothetical protein
VFQGLTPTRGRHAASWPGQHLKIHVTGITLMTMPAHRRDRASVQHVAARVGARRSPRSARRGQPRRAAKTCARTAGRRALICRPTGGPRPPSRLGIRTRERSRSHSYAYSLAPTHALICRIGAGPEAALPVVSGCGRGPISRGTVTVMTSVSQRGAQILNHKDFSRRIQLASVGVTVAPWKRSGGSAYCERS